MNMHNQRFNYALFLFQCICVNSLVIRLCYRLISFSKMSRELCNESTGPNQTGALTKQQFLEVSVDLLGKHSWLYDFQMTEIFCHNLLEDNFPSSVSVMDFDKGTEFYLGL